MKYVLISSHNRRKEILTILECEELASGRDGVWNDAVNTDNKQIL